MSIKSKAGKRARGEATRTAIIETAEMLFAEHGVNGVSLRRIGVASGSANTNAVAYHFGDRDALINAIIRHRLPVIESVRRQLLQERESTGEPLTLRDLLFILYQPVIQQRNPAGERSYAAFLGGLFRSAAAWKRYSFGQDYPTTTRIIDMFLDHLDLDRRVFRARMKICTNMVVSSLDLLEKEGVLGEEEEAAQFADVLAMAEFALRAPHAGPPAAAAAAGAARRKSASARS